MGPYRASVLIRLFPSRLRLRQSEKRCKQRFGASPVEDAGRSWKRCWPGLPIGEAGRSRKRAPFLLGQAFRSERRAGVGSAFRSERRARVGNERRSSLARPSGRRLDRPSGLSLGFWAGSGVERRSQRRLLGRAFAEKQVYEGPGFIKPTLYIDHIVSSGHIYRVGCLSSS